MFKKYVICVLAIALILSGVALRNSYCENEIIFNIDEVDYFIYKGKRHTIDSLIQQIIDEKKYWFMAEMMKRLK